MGNRDLFYCQHFIVPTETFLNSLRSHIIPESVGRSDMSIVAINALLVMQGNSKLLCVFVESKLIKKSYRVRPCKEQLPREVEYRRVLLQDHVVDACPLHGMSEVQPNRA